MPQGKKHLSGESGSSASQSRFRSLSDPETLAKIAQNLEEGIYITTESGEILDANPAFRGAVRTVLDTCI